MLSKNNSITGLSAVTAVALAACTVACGDAPTSPAAMTAMTAQNRLVGTVTARTANGGVPLEGAVVTHLATGRSVTTNGAGAYSIDELPDGFATITVIKDGYESVTRSLSVSGETRLDLQLVRREPLPPSVLWGVVSEKTASGQVPIAGVHVEDSNIHMSSKTDAEGRYRLDFRGIDRSLFDGFVSLYVAKEGYQTISRWEIAVSGDTRLDIEIVRR